MLSSTENSWDRQRRAQFREFVINGGLVGFGESLSDFGVEVAAAAFTETMCGLAAGAEPEYVK